MLNLDALEGLDRHYKEQYMPIKMPDSRRDSGFAGSVRASRVTRGV
jgi:hypothetical protein